MHKTISIAAIITFLFLSLSSSAQLYKHEAGVRLGSADQALSTGFSYRYHINETKAIEGIINLKDNARGIGALYEIFKPIAAVESLRWFYGAGGYAAFEGNDVLGITGIAGLDYTFKEAPVNLSIDWKPELSFLKDVSFKASTVAVSVRIAFGK
ncbi:MAG: hypothetical protein K2X48_18225 [Chitinophagaceae bacterium]|nr:hypothetical protein [Chitinophagaceae bacterium]